MRCRSVRYDHPERFRGLASAERELTRLEQSLSTATLRGDKRAADYLTRRHQRARAAYLTLRAHLANHHEETP